MELYHGRLRIKIVLCLNVCQMSWHIAFVPSAIANASFSAETVKDRETLRLGLIIPEIMCRML